MAAELLAARLMDRLQSGLNAEAWLVYSAWKCDKFSGTNSIPPDSDCLSMQEQFSTFVYLSDELYITILRLLSASTAVLIVARSKYSMIGERTFPVVAAKAWYTLPADITSAPSLPSFKRKLKT